MDNTKDKLYVLKFPLRTVTKILLILTIIILFLNKQIIWNNYKNCFTEIFFILCMVEFWLIIYSFRNRTYLYIDKDSNRFLIKNKELISSLEKDFFNSFRGTKRYNFNYKFSDFLLDRTMLANKKKLKEKIIVFTSFSSKYQIRNITKACSFININIYKIKFINKKEKTYILLNEL